MKIKLEDGIYRIYEDRQIGSVEFIESKRYIENIYLEERCRGKGYLRKIIDYFGKPLIVLPLHQHTNKFKHLGFKFYEKHGDDSYYILN